MEEGIYISSNGYITFGDDSPLKHYNRGLDSIGDPLNPGPSNMTAPFRDDLNPEVGGNIYMRGVLDEESIPRRFIVLWDEIGRHQGHAIQYHFF